MHVIWNSVYVQNKRCTLSPYRFFPFQKGSPFQFKFENILTSVHFIIVIEFVWHDFITETDPEVFAVNRLSPGRWYQLSLREWSSPFAQHLTQAENPIETFPISTDWKSGKLSVSTQYLSIQVSSGTSRHPPSPFNKLKSFEFHIAFITGSVSEEFHSISIWMLLI